MLTKMGGARVFLIVKKGMSMMSDAPRCINQAHPTIPEPDLYVPVTVQQRGEVSG